ncbi:MAG TPA: tRNA-dihydrouridine synthase family protein [Gammaproteobacteria bacterium]|nr:tRNA-dihydrouridine synthase family protein [Gammaproteobacteria bacterium]
MRILINTLQLGNQTFPVNLIQGPLAGVSSAPFRRLIWRYSKPAFVCTEMISCKSILHQSKASLQRLIQIDPTEGPVCFQLSANDPKELAEATQKITAEGAHLIDLNCGCPVKKIRGKGAGSSHLADPLKLYHLITAMKQNTHVPVSVKIRVDGGSSDAFNAEIAKVVFEAGADFLVVHGRHWTEHYETPCRYDDIQFFVEQLKIPVIGNGDIACPDSLKKMFATKCAGVMISRAGVGQPWLIQQLISKMQNTLFHLPSRQEIGEIFIEHIQQLEKLLGHEKWAILHARKLAKYYARGLENKMAFCVAVNACDNLLQLKDICQRFFIHHF